MASEPPDFGETVNRFDVGRTGAGQSQAVSHDSDEQQLQQAMLLDAPLSGEFNRLLLKAQV